MTGDLFIARQQRDVGIAKTAHKNESWLERCLAKLPQMRLYNAFTTGEQLRVWMLESGIENPTSQHAWGALIRTAMKRGLLRDTGRVAQMTTEKSHARRTPLWEIV